ncbi:MAG: hypothetical protein JSR17_13675 [Proteobacteria bacterium]|nr:hypothetical protein [Pseudomonadota bacterium]
MGAKGPKLLTDEKRKDLRNQAMHKLYPPSRDIEAYNKDPRKMLVEALVDFVLEEDEKKREQQKEKIKTHLDKSRKVSNSFEGFVENVNTTLFELQQFIVTHSASLEGHPAADIQRDLYLSIVPKILETIKPTEPQVQAPKKKVNQAIAPRALIDEDLMKKTGDVVLTESEKRGWRNAGTFKASGQETAPEFRPAPIVSHQALSQPQSVKSQEEMLVISANQSIIALLQKRFDKLESKKDPRQQAMKLILDEAQNPDHINGKKLIDISGIEATIKQRLKADNDPRLQIFINETEKETTGDIKKLKGLIKGEEAQSEHKEMKDKIEAISMRTENVIRASKPIEADTEITAHVLKKPL